MHHFYLSFYARNSNFPTRIRCYETKIVKSSKHKWNTILPSQSNDRIWHQLYIGAEDERRPGAWHTTGWGWIQAFPAAVKRLSRVHMCNSQKERISKLLGSAYGSLEAFLSQFIVPWPPDLPWAWNCPSVPRWTWDITRLYVHSVGKWYNFANWKLTESSVLLVHCKYALGK